MKNKIFVMIILSTLFTSACSAKQNIATTEVTQMETITHQSIETNTIPPTPSTEAETETEVAIRHGSINAPIPLGESYTYKFGIAKYSNSYEDTKYGYATAKITSNENNVISVNVNFDSCDGGYALELGKDIMSGGYFTTVSESMQENTFGWKDIGTNKEDLYKSETYDPVYPGGNVDVYVNGNNAKYLVIHHNVYDKDDEINSPDDIEVQEIDGVKHELHYYRTWFLLK